MSTIDDIRLLKVRVDKIWELKKREARIQVYIDECRR